MLAPKEETLFTRAWGARDAPALVLLHGFMGTSADWEPIAQELAADFHVLAVDLPGHGDSLERPESDYTLAGAAVAVVDAVRAEGVSGHFVLAGYSMGGRLSLQIARGHGQSVAGLCLISAHTGLRGSLKKGSRLREDQARADSLVKDFHGFMERWFSLPMFSSMDAELVDLVKQVRLAAGTPKELARALVGLSVGGQDDFRSWFLGSSIPKRFLVGESDPKYAELAASLCREDQMPATTPPAMVRIAEKAGHNLLVESPGALVEELRRLMPAAE